MQDLRENYKALRGVKGLIISSWFGRLNIVKIPIFPYLIHRIKSNFYQKPNRFVFGGGGRN